MLAIYGGAGGWEGEEGMAVLFHRQGLNRCLKHSEKYNALNFLVYKYLLVNKPV